MFRTLLPLAAIALASPALAAEDTELMDSTFNTLDSNGDRTVTRGELASFPLLAAGFAAADANGDLALSNDEFRDLIRLTRRQSERHENRN